MVNPSPGVWMHHLELHTVENSTRGPDWLQREVRLAGEAWLPAQDGAGRIAGRPPASACYVWSILIFLAVVSGGVTGAGARTSRTPSL